MRINNNVMAINSHRQLGMNNIGSQKSMEKLSSGYRINRAGDDAAGLAISEKMRGQIRGLNQASRNAQDGISLIQTAEGALNEAHAVLQRIRELAVQSGNGTNVSTDRDALNAEVEELKKELNRIADTTEFNTQKLLNGKFGASGTTVYNSTETANKSGVTFHVGANEHQIVQLNIDNLSVEGLIKGLSGGSIEVTSGSTALTGQVAADKIDITTRSGANVTVQIIDYAIAKLSDNRSKLGAVQNRLEYTVRNLDNASENLQGAESRIRDVDMAKEMMTFTKQNILSQAATAMLAQANQAPQSVLQLLG